MKPTTYAKLFRDVLCPVDFSRHSRKALRYAAALTASTRGHLTVLFVEDPLLAGVAAYGTTSLSASTRAELQRFVDSTIAPRRRKIGSITLEIGVGRPSREICRAARRFGCDTIILGSHGLTGAAKMILGSTTQEVLGHAHVPVLAIPAFKRRPSAWTHLLAPPRRKTRPLRARQRA